MGKVFERKKATGFEQGLGFFFWRKAGEEKERLQVWIIIFNLLIILFSVHHLLFLERLKKSELGRKAKLWKTGL